MRERAWALALALALAWPLALRAQEESAALERVTFDAAVARALERNPGVGQAEQTVLRAEALLARASSVFRPTLDGFAGTIVLDDARGFSGNITQPRTQSTFYVTAEFPVLAAARWAERTQARDQVGVARVSAEQTRVEVAATAAEAYLAVLASQRQRDIAEQSRDTARALAEYARLRLEAGQGSRLNFVRASQELASAEALLESAALALRATQEALGVALFSDGPLDADGDPEIRRAAPPGAGEAWLDERPDIRFLTAQERAAERVLRDNWKSWLPTLTASFTPQYVTPKGFFAPAKTWRAEFELDVPIYDGTLGATKRVRRADHESALLRLQAARNRAESEMRLALETVSRRERIAAEQRGAAENAAEALRISEIAYRAGATTNIEVVEAQQTARNAALGQALAEDRLRQARLALLVALGQFPD